MPNAHTESAGSPAAKKTTAKRTGTKGAAAETTTAAKKTPAKATTAANKAADAPAPEPAESTRPDRTQTTEKASVTSATRRTKADASAADLAVRADESPWTPAELAEQTTVLQSDRNRLIAEIAEADRELANLLADSADSSGDDTADSGGKTFDREHELSLANNTRELLEQVERALARIEDGTYGSCEACGNPIGKARLQAFPRATLCVPCKQREERR
jgi:RNA polymerase-binding protein DksA